MIIRTFGRNGLRETVQQLARRYDRLMAQKDGLLDIFSDVRHAREASPRDFAAKPKARLELRSDHCRHPLGRASLFSAAAPAGNGAENYRKYGSGLIAMRQLTLRQLIQLYTQLALSLSYAIIPECLSKPARSAIISSATPRSHVLRAAIL